MARFTPSSALLLAVTLAGLAPAVSAQTPAAPTPDADKEKETAPATSDKATASAVTNPAAPAREIAPAPKRSRAISGDVANMLSATMPKFTPPPPPPTAAELAQRKADEEAAKKQAEIDMRDVDKPQNGIVRLKKFEVREDRPAILTERSVYTKDGLKDLAMKRYYNEAGRAMNRFYVPLFSAWTVGGNNATEQRALMMYSEDERLKNMADVADNTNMVMRSDAKAGSAMKQEAQSTFMRRSEFGYGGMGRK